MSQKEDYDFKGLIDYEVVLICMKLGFTSCALDEALVQECYVD